MHEHTRSYRNRVSLAQSACLPRCLATDSQGKIKLSNSNVMVKSPSEILRLSSPVSPVAIWTARQGRVTVPLERDVVLSIETRIQEVQKKRVHDTYVGGVCGVCVCTCTRNTRCGLIALQRNATKNILCDKSYFRPLKNKPSEAFKK